MDNECLYCKEINRKLRDGKDIEIYTVNGWQAAKLLESLSLKSDHTRLDQIRKLSTQELSSGRWCRGCIKRYK